MERLAFELRCMNARTELSTDVFGTYVFKICSIIHIRCRTLSCSGIAMSQPGCFCLLWHLSLFCRSNCRPPTPSRRNSRVNWLIFLHRQVSLLFLYFINSTITTCYSYVCNYLLLHFIASIIQLFRFSAFIYWFSSRVSFIGLLVAQCDFHTHGRVKSIR